MPKGSFAELIKTKAKLLGEKAKTYIKTRRERKAEERAAAKAAQIVDGGDGPVPTVPVLEAELKRVNYNMRFRRLLRSTIYTLIIVSACAVLVAVIFLPVLRIYGSSMTPTLNESEIVVSIKGVDVRPGDVVALYYGSKVLVKRCIAVEHQWVDIDSRGYVYVDGEPLLEPYIKEFSYGGKNTNIEFPYQVPDNTIFVMGDHRATSVDSRNTSVGCIATEDIVGKIVFKVWPLDSFGRVS